MAFVTRTRMNLTPERRVMNAPRIVAGRVHNTSADSNKRLLGSSAEEEVDDDDNSKTKLQSSIPPTRIQKSISPFMMFLAGIKLGLVKKKRTVESKVKIKQTKKRALHVSGATFPAPRFTEMIIVQNVAR